MSLELSVPPIECSWDVQVEGEGGDRSQTSEGIGLPACGGSGRAAGSGNPHH